MAAAVIQGLLTSGSSRPDQLSARDVRADALAALKAAHGIATAQDNAAVAGADMVVLSVKPQVLPGVLAELAPQLGANTLVVSIAGTGALGWRLSPGP